MNALKKTHYELFGLPEGFVVDASALDDAYRRVQGAVHPDRFSAASDTDRRIAMQLATHANEAYRTLRDPVARATYLCGLHGVDPRCTPIPRCRRRSSGSRWSGASGSTRCAPRSMRRSSPPFVSELEASRRTLLEGIAQSIDARGEYAGAAELVRQLMFVERFEVDVDALDERLAEH